MTDATPEPRERLRDALIGLRDHGYQPRHNGRPSCPFCSRFVGDEETHAPGCVLLNLPATPASPPPPDGPTFTAIEMPLGEDWEPVIHSGPLDPVAVIGNVFACTCGFSNPRGYPAVTRMHNLHHALQAEDSAEQSAPADSALRTAAKAAADYLAGMNDPRFPGASRHAMALYSEVRVALDSKPSDSERLREALDREERAIGRDDRHSFWHPEPENDQSQWRCMPVGAALAAIHRIRAAAIEATPPDSGSRLPPDPAPLDVERLAKAFHLAQRWCDGTESSTWRTDSAADQDATALAIHGDDAKAVAREYAALSGEAPSPVAEPRE
jgi:hypothetical protein